MRRLGYHHLLLLLLLLGRVSPVIAQMQSITTYGGSGGIQTTTISPTYGGGYNYTTFGGPNSGSWEGVSASPGTTVQAAIGAHGSVVPIVSTVPASVVAPAPDPALVSAQIAAANAQELAADFQLLQSLPPAPRRPVAQKPSELHKEIPPPAAYNNNTYGKYAWLHNQLSRDCMKQLATDWQRDSASKPGDMHDPRVLLAYLRLWVRAHPGCLSGKVLNSQVQSTQ